MTTLPPVIGRAVRRRDSADKASGTAAYTDDLQRPGMLYAALLASPHPSARINSIDISAAKALSGVKAVVVGDDLPRRRWGPFVQDETPLAVEVVRYVGEPVAAVVAKDATTARAALALIDVDYVELAPVLSIEDALSPEAIAVHSEFERYEKRADLGADGVNEVTRQEISEGDVDNAWADCDAIVEGTYEVPSQSHVYLETVSAIAEFDQSGKLTVWSANQSVSKVLSTLSKALDLPMSKIRVVTPAVGGGFGGKSGVTIQPLVAHLALIVGKPVKLTLTREDDFLMMRRRHPAVITVKTGAKADGTLVARDLEVIYDGGAYAEDSPAVLGFGLLMGRGPYRIPHCRLRGRVVYTNKLRAGGFRGFGNPQVTFATESQLDELAARLDLDPLELRLRNALNEGERWIGGQRITSCAFKACLERARQASDWDERRRAPRGASDGKMRGIGVSGLSHICGLMGTAATIRMLEDGTVTLATGAIDLGQGADTALSQICAGALLIDLDDVNLTAADSDAVPYNWSTGGSRVTYMVGRAIMQAADEVRQKLIEHAAEILECAPEDAELRPGGHVGLVGIPEKVVTFRDISLRGHHREGGPILGTGALVYDGEPFDPKQATIRNYPFERIGTYVFGAQIVEIEVDTLTGQVSVLRAWSAHDVGRAINPMAIEGQIHGGFAQGMGYALLEELVWEDGQPINPTMMDYKVPGAPDLPMEIHPIIVENPEPSGPFGAKGVGEPPLIGVAPAIANALAHAVDIRLRRIPMTPERVLDALDQAAQEERLRSHQHKQRQQDENVGPEASYSEAGVTSSNIDQYASSAVDGERL